MTEGGGFLCGVFRREKGRQMVKLYFFGGQEFFRLD